MKRIALRVFLLLTLAVGVLLPLEGLCSQELLVQLTVSGATQEKRGASIDECFSGVDVAKVTKVVISEGAVKAADWQWLAEKKAELIKLEEFEITEGVESVENIPDRKPQPGYGYSIDPCMPISIKHIKVAKLDKIGKSAFINLKNLQTATFPNTRYIDKYAFQGCESLVKIDFPKLLDIQSSGFKNCAKLASVSLPKVKYIWHEAFRNCVALETIEAPEAEKIGSMTFDFYKKGGTIKPNVLKKVHFPNVYQIEHKAFRGAALEEAVFPKLKYLGDLVFADCSTFSKLTLGPTAPVAGIGGSTMKQIFDQCPRCAI